MDTARTASEWRAESPLFPFLLEHFPGQDSEFTLSGRATELKPCERYMVGGTSCSTSVMQLQTDDEFVYVTAGLANMVLLQERQFGFDVAERKHGFELVFRLAKTESQKEKGTKAHPPEFPRELLLRITHDRNLDPMPPSTPNTRVLVPNIVPESVHGVPVESITTRRFMFAAADHADVDGAWATVLDDVHGPLRFLFVVGVTEDEKLWSKRHGFDKLAARMREAALRRDEEHPQPPFGLNTLTRASVVAKKKGGLDDAASSVSSNR